MEAADLDVDLLALGSINGIGHQTLRLLVDHFGDLARVWHEDPPVLRDVLAEARVRNPEGTAGLITSRSGQLREEGLRVRNKLAAEGIRLFGMHESEFPRRLRGIQDPPYWILVHGDPSVLSTPPMVAIVGTRAASSIGRKTAERLATLVVGDGLGVVSGLAEGIDAAAHRAVSSLGVPQVAVLGTGIDVEFPRSTVDLRHKIVAQGGALVSEYLPGDTYSRARFVQRDRIQAALAHVVCPVEARLKSGTAHTVEFARRYGRPVFGVEYGTPAETNEMPAFLRAQGDQVVDLGTSGGVEQLKELLRGIDDGRRRTPPGPPPPGDYWGPVLEAVDRVQASSTPTPYLQHWLINELEGRFGLRGARLDPGEGGS